MSRKLKLDFTGVESFNRAGEGQHSAKIITAEMKQSQGGNDMIVVTFEVTKGADKGSRVMENYPLTETALWKLKGMLQAIGMKADGKVQVDLDKVVGKACIISVIHEEYDGKTRAKVDECKKFVATAEAEDEDEEDDDEEEEVVVKKPVKKAPAKKPVVVEEDDEDEDEEDDEEDDDEDEAPAKKPVKKAPAKQAPAKKAPVKKSSKKVVEEDEDDDDDDDWDDEE